MCLDQLLLAVIPEVPQLSRDLSRRDTVRVVRDQTQQKDAVASQVRVDETNHHLLVPDGAEPLRFRPADVLVIGGPVAVPGASPQMVAHEANAVLWNQRPNKPKQETGNTSQHSRQSLACV